MSEKYGDARRTQIKYAAGEFNEEDFVADEDMIITISHLGYIKATPLPNSVHRDAAALAPAVPQTRDKDFIEHIYTASMHNTMLFFTDKGPGV